MNNIIKKLTDKVKIAILELLLKIEQQLSESMNKSLTEPECLIAWQGIKMISSGNIITLQGKAGSHKSHLAEEIAIVLLEKPGCGFSSKLGMFKISSNAITVAYVDSERDSFYELPKALKNIADNACISIPCLNFRYISVRDIDRLQRKHAAEVFIEQIRENYRGDLVVIVDVATDLSVDFNSVTDSGEIIDLFKKWMYKYNCAIIAIIHENPGSSDKMRGHLGTELLNKTSISIKTALASPDKIIIKFLKIRSYKLPEDVWAVFNEHTKRLVKYSPTYTTKNQDLFNAKLVELFSKNAKESRQNILEQTESMGLSVDTRDNYLNATKQLTIDGVIYDLLKSKSGKETIYELARSEMNI